MQFSPFIHFNQFFCDRYPEETFRGFKKSTCVCLSETECRVAILHNDSTIMQETTAVTGYDASSFLNCRNQKNIHICFLFTGNYISAKMQQTYVTLYYFKALTECRWVNIPKTKPSKRNAAIVGHCVKHHAEGQWVSTEIVLLWIMEGLCRVLGRWVV